MAAQVHGDDPVGRRQFLELFFPTGGVGSQAVDQDQCFAGAAIDIRHFYTGAVPGAVNQAPG